MGVSGFWKWIEACQRPVLSMTPHGLMQAFGTGAPLYRVDIDALSALTTLVHAARRDVLGEPPPVPAPTDAATAHLCAETLLTHHLEQLGGPDAVTALRAQVEEAVAAGAVRYADQLWAAGFTQIAFLFDGPTKAEKCHEHARRKRATASRHILYVRRCAFLAAYAAAAAAASAAPAPPTIEQEPGSSAPAGNNSGGPADAARRVLPAFADLRTCPHLRRIRAALKCSGGGNRTAAHAPPFASTDRPRQRRKKQQQQQPKAVTAAVAAAEVDDDALVQDAVTGMADAVRDYVHGTLVADHVMGVPDMLRATRRALAECGLEGVACLDAAGDGELYGAQRGRAGDSDALMTADSDAVIMGAPRVVRTVPACSALQAVVLEDVLRLTGLATGADLVDVCIAAGCDYTLAPGLPGIGLARAPPLLRAHGTLERLLAAKPALLDAVTGGCDGDGCSGVKFDFRAARVAYGFPADRPTGDSGSAASSSVTNQYRE